MRREECLWKKHCDSHECEECQEGYEVQDSLAGREEAGQHGLGGGT